MNVNDKELPTEEHIISALQYLYWNCPTEEMKPIVGIALNLCKSSTRAKLENSEYSYVERVGDNFKGFISAIEYLRNEAARNKLSEMQSILEAAFCLCFVSSHAKNHINASFQ